MVLNTASCYSLTKRLLPTAREGYVYRGVCLFTGGRVSLVPCAFQGVEYPGSRVSRGRVSKGIGYLGGRIPYLTPPPMDCRAMTRSVHIVLECFLVFFVVVARSGIKLHKNIIE